MLARPFANDLSSDYHRPATDDALGDPRYIDDSPSAYPTAARADPCRTRPKPGIRQRPTGPATIRSLAAAAISQHGPATNAAGQ